MRIETAEERIELIRHFVSKLPSYNINDVPLPADAQMVKLDAADVSKLWEEFIKNSGKKHPPSHYYNLYVHIPFCRSKCYYCIYDSVKFRSGRDVDDYIDFLISKADFFSPVFRDVVFQNIHVGGGTPTLLEEKQLAKLFRNLFGKFRFAGDASRVIECNPEGITTAKAKLLKDFGFNKISMGVQSLDSKVLGKVNRKGQTRQSVKRAIETLKEQDLHSINCDLMMGLAGDNASTFLKSLDQLMDMQPATIMLAKVQPPKHYLKKYFNGNYHTFVEFFDREFVGAVPDMLKTASSHGFEVDNPHPNELGWRFWKKNFKPHYDVRKPYYCTGGEFPSSCFSIGHFSKSRIFGRLMCEYGGVGSKFNKSESVFYGFRINVRHETLRYLFNQISRNRSVSKSSFKTIYGFSMDELYGHLLEELAGLGIVEVKNDTVRFIPEDTEELYVCSRLFLDRPTLVSSMAPVDREMIRVNTAAGQFIFVIEHCREDSTYIETSGDLGLIGSASKEDNANAETALLVERFMSSAFTKIVQGSPSISAHEAAGLLVKKSSALRKILPPEAGFLVELLKI